LRPIVPEVLFQENVQPARLTKCALILSRTSSIVAVHGLDEDHITAWTDPVSKVLWLRDLIPRYIPSARILTYGYDSDVSSASSSGSSERFLQHAQTLVAELDADRLLENTTERPIIFICHGIGGILVKNALAYSSSMVAKDVAHLYGIFVSTYGILFMGTPHDGVEQMSWSVMARNTEGHPSALLEAIAKGSETLQSINDQFAPLVKRFRIHFFWEQQETVTETFARYKVEEKSAAPIWDNTERSGISASHAQMCKFGSVDAPGFTVVRATLRRYALEANDVITPRWRDAKQHIERQRSIEAAEILRHDIRITTKPSDDIRDSAKCNKHFRVPFSASNFFTGRADVAKRLERSMLRSSESAIPQIQKRFILYGLGGSGKTQFCLKFVQDHRQRYSPQRQIKSRFLL